MQAIFWIIFGLVLIAGLFFYGRCELLVQKNEELETKLYDMKAIKNRSQLMMIRDLYNEYKKGGNPYTALSEIGNIINKTALDSDQTTNTVDT